MDQVKIDRCADPLGSHHFDRFVSLSGQPELAKSSAEQLETENAEPLHLSKPQEHQPDEIEQVQQIQDYLFEKPIVAADLSKVDQTESFVTAIDQT